MLLPVLLFVVAGEEVPFVRDAALGEQVFEPDVRLHQTAPVAMTDIHVNAGHLILGYFAQPSFDVVGIIPKYRQAVRAERAEVLPIFEGNVQRPTPAARQPTNRAIFPLWEGAVVLVDPGHQLGHYRLAEHIGIWLGVQLAVAGHDDQEWRSFTSADQAVGSLVRSQAVPLVVVIALTVDEIKDRIADFSFPIVAGWQVDAERHGFGEEGTFQLMQNDFARILKTRG